MPRKLTFMVDSEIPSIRAQRSFYDRLLAGWGLLREEPVGPLEAVGIGFLWTSRVGEFGSVAALPRPWSLIRNGLVERGAISPKAHVFMLRSEVVPIGRAGELPKLLVHMERA